MNICHQNPLSGQAFEQVNDILDDEQGPSQVQILTFKINEMQKIISTLSKTNQRLIYRIQQLEEALQQKNTAEQTTSFNEEYSVMQCDFNDIEEIIKEYRKELTTYQQTITAQLKEKVTLIDLLRHENEQMNNTNQRLNIKVQELQMQNQMLLQTKDNLLNEIQQLESSVRKSKVQSPRYNNRYSESIDYMSKYQDLSTDFNTNVQRQLERLIEKLMKQLEHQRNLKKKLTDEVRKLQKDILDQQKQLNSKNNKIYAMQMTALKNYKINNTSLTLKQKNQRYQSRGNKNAEQRHRPNGQRQNGVQSTPSTKSKTFTLMELMNECMVLNSKEKLVIALKIIDFFLKKFQKHDYSSQILESIVVCNFSVARPQLCTLRVNKEIQRDHNNDQRENSQSQGIWNLAFILDNLFNQTDTRDKDFGFNQSQGSAIETVIFMLENKDQNLLRSVLELRRIVESAIKERNP